ncbi:MAG: cytochrome P450 [Burkholderiaceae bacterium]
MTSSLEGAPPAGDHALDDHRHAETPTDDASGPASPVARYSLGGLRSFALPYAQAAASTLQRSAEDLGAFFASRIPARQLAAIADAAAPYLPAALRSPVAPDIAHYEGMPIAGKGLQVLTAKNFNEFIVETRSLHDRKTPGARNYEAMSFHLLDKPCVMIMDAEDHRNTCLSEMVTKLGNTPDEASPLGEGVEHMLGHESLVMMDAFDLGGDKNPAYFKQRKVMMSHLSNGTRIEAYVNTRMPAIIDRCFVAAARDGGDHPIAPMLLSLTMDLEGGFLGFEKVRPSAFLAESPDNQAFFEDLLAQLTHPLLAIQPTRRAELIKGGDAKLRAYGNMMMAGNWEVFRDAVDNKKPNLIVDLFEQVSFEGKKFPRTHPEFVDIGKASPAKMMDFMRKIYAMQVVAGEYTAPVADFAIREIFNRPEVLARMRAELDGLGPGEIVEGNHAKCPYSYAVVLETLRLYPPVAIQPGRVRKDFRPTVGGKEVPILKDTLMLFDLKRLNESMEDPIETETGEVILPTDFHPERYLSRPGIGTEHGSDKFLKSLLRRPDALHSFAGNYGRLNRICPAHKLVINELLMIVAAATKYDLGAKDDEGRELDRISCEEHAPATTRPRVPVRYAFNPRPIAATA